MSVGSCSWSTCNASGAANEPVSAVRLAAFPETKAGIAATLVTSARRERHVAGRARRGRELAEFS
eukprot:772780-Prymnesium_polylepis.2